jgi:hypothetical protein
MSADTPASTSKRPRIPESASPAEQLAGYRQRYRELAAQVAEVGFIIAGTVIQRSTRCAAPGCRCHADPPQLHGPYWQWTTKIANKTVTRRLTDRQAELYNEWAANNRHVRQLITQMHEISARAAELITTSETKTGD